MRFRAVHRLGVVALYLFVHLGLGGCSSSQQQQGDEVEASEGNSEGGDETVTDNSEAGGDNVAASNATDELNNTATADAEKTPNQTGNDLQEIISEMNTAGQPATETANAAAVPVNPAPAAEAAPAAAPAAEAPTTAGVPAGPALPEFGSKMPYIVQSGDTLGKIAQKIYGNIARWTEIRDLTNLNNPSRIFPGDVVYYQLSKESQSFASAYEALPRSEVTVAQGDTLATISQKVYGKSGKWREIWRCNDSVNNPDQLTVGQTIYYVAQGASTGSLASKAMNVAKVLHKANLAKVSVAKKVMTQEIVKQVNSFNFLTVSANVFGFANVLNVSFAA